MLQKACDNQLRLIVHPTISNNFIHHPGVFVKPDFWTINSIFPNFRDVLQKKGGSSKFSAPREHPDAKVVNFFS